MNLVTNKKIAIVGGGPGGLTLTRLLQLQGADVKVYERDFNKDVRVQGATLDLHQDSGLKALEKAGLMDAFKQHYRPGADQMRITDEQATIFYDQHTEENAAGFDDEHFRPEIDRGPLRKLLLESLQPGIAPVRVAVLQTAAQAILPSALALLAEREPGLRVEIAEVPPDHPILHMMFQVSQIPQITSINFWRRSGGVTSERGSDSPHADLRMIADDRGHVMVLMTHNTDVGDSWEREGEDHEFFLQFSPNGYALGTNVVLYSLTH